LKTIISLTPEPPIADLQLFAEMAGIKIIHLPISRMASLTEAAHTTLVSAVNLIIEGQNHPVYVHCLDGRRITSLVVLMLRRAQGWSPLSALSEYWRYQVGFRSLIPTLEVEKTTKELELFVAQLNDVVLPESMPKWLWGGDRSVVVPGVQLKSTHNHKDHLKEKEKEKEKEKGKEKEIFVMDGTAVTTSAPSITTAAAATVVSTGNNSSVGPSS